jgi:two-component system, NarL family, sensor histidine kinase DesK
MALSAAGIEADVQESRAALDPPVEAVLAWAVREGATNVIRHSGASHCTLKITTSLTDAGVEVIDDGRGAVTNGNSAGLPSTGVGARAGNGVADNGVAGNARTAGGAGNRHARVGDGHATDAGDSHATDASDGQATRAGKAHPSASTGGLGVGGIGGHGLAGLAERARLLNGWIEAGTLAGGGYRLAVSVPVARA